MEMTKFTKYLLAFALFAFYFYIAINSGALAAVAVFIKTLALVVFGLAHVWVLDLFRLLGKVIGGIKWSFTSLLGYSRLSQYSSYSQNSTLRKWFG